MAELTETWVYLTLEVMALTFIFLVGAGVITALVMYIIDVTQTKHTIRRNYPVIGRFRYWFEHLGGFFRQYFFAMDREELPFNRAERSWVYRAAKNEINTVAFGSTRDLRPVGSVLFVNCPYPTLGQDAVSSDPIVIGPGSQHPFSARSIFNISGMSFGSLSKPAIKALSLGAKKAGCWLNTGEGGLSSYHLHGGADLVFQIGTAKFGVRNADGSLSDDKLKEVASHQQVRMFEIKLSQGAKPGKGGILPGEKVTEEIAQIRGIEVGKDAISPNRHHDINSPDELLDMIERVRRVTGKPTGFKTVIGAYGWLDTLFERIKERGDQYAPDFITLDGAEGGTGAAPMALMDYVGLPLYESLPMLVDMLDRHQLRPRVKVICSGKLVTPASVAWAIAVGAEFVVSARGFMFSLGCIQALQCNKNTCPTGITTHDPRLQRGLVPEGKAERVAHYVNNMNHEVGVLAHACGVPEPRRLKRFHARVVMTNGRSIPLNELYPDVN